MKTGHEITVIVLVSMETKKILTLQFLDTIPTNSIHSGEGLKTAMDLLPSISFLRRSLL